MDWTSIRTAVSLANPSGLPIFEIASPRRTTMMLTTIIISNSVKPCCFIFILISIWGIFPHQCGEYISLIFGNCHKHLLGMNADAHLQNARLLQYDSATVK